MSERQLSPEEELLQAALTETDRVPSHVTDYARAVFEWRNIDLELAALTSDTTAGALEGVRGAGDARFSFSGPEGSTLEISYEVATARLSGEINPGASGTCELLTSSEPVEATVENGRFNFSEVPSGPVSVAVRLDDGRSFKTEWMTL